MGRKLQQQRIQGQRGQHEIQRIAAYLRVSTDEQARSGLGLDDQLRRAQAMAEVKGWPTPVVYADEGISGTKGPAQRPALARLMEEVRASQVDAIIVLELSRLARRTRLILDLVEELGEHGVSLVSCKESLDTTTPHGNFVLTMFAALAQLERDQIAERTRAALAAHSLRNGESGGRMPYGYRRGAGVSEVVVDVAAAAVVRRIVAERKRRMTLRAIADELNAAEMLSPWGSRWWASSVRQVLSNLPAYRGGKRGTSNLRWPPILGK